ncbi:uncharacterized protein LOC134210910 [Armigeres subalbatus]|uniref:uncharacterized protein LOC134210910 n=1 Tax=Armigeres subalbatus TaxID=124917 RepID=UPI002ED1BCBE
MSNIIIQTVRHQHAAPSTVYHALYGYYFLGIPRKELSRIYGKSTSTIGYWILKYEENGVFKRKQRLQVYKKFSASMREWLVDLYRREPVLLLEEARDRFQKHFYVTISVSSVCIILHEAGMTWKCIERRAIQIREDEITRFVRDMLAIPWDLSNLVFLDEVSFDNREMLSKKGYGIVGNKILYRGEFCRKPRVSFLCFLGVGGMADSFWTEGTFNRRKFFECCRKFALNNKEVRKYPGFPSVWILDGARIHCDVNIIRYLRSIGIIPIFLPPYCPFFNPIEILFGLIKRNLKIAHLEGAPILADICDAMNRFKVYPCAKIFEHCGYFPGGTFLPEKGLQQDVKNIGLNITTR